MKVSVKIFFWLTLIPYCELKNTLLVWTKNWRVLIGNAFLRVNNKQLSPLCPYSLYRCFHHFSFGKSCARVVKFARSCRVCVGPSLRFTVPGPLISISDIRIRRGSLYNIIIFCYILWSWIPWLKHQCTVFCKYVAVRCEWNMGC